MNWGSLISTVLPTIGTVVGSLLGTDAIEDGVVSFSHNSVVGAQDDFSSVFYKEDDKYYLYNQSASQDDVVAMTFPGRGDVGAETVLVPGRHSFDVTPMFQENGQQDNSQFELSAGTVAQQKEDAQVQDEGIKISSSGKDIPVGGEEKAIGSFLSVQAEKNQITVSPRNGVTINSLPVVAVKSGGETSMRVLDATGSGDTAVVPLPQPLVDNDLVSVEVVANVDSQNISNLLKLQAEKRCLLEINDDKAERISKAPKLNWR